MMAYIYTKDFTVSRKLRKENNTVKSIPTLDFFTENSSFTSPINRYTFIDLTSTITLQKNLPYRKLETNKLVLELTIIAYDSSRIT